MSDELDLLPGRIPKPQSAQELAYRDYLIGFTNETLIPSLSRMFSQQEKRWDAMRDEMEKTNEREKQHLFNEQNTLIKGLDAQSRDSWRTMHETMNEFRTDIKENRSAREQQMRISLELQHAGEDIVDKNAKQDEAIEALKTENQDLKVRLRSSESAIELLNKSYANMVEVLMGNAATPGAIAQIDENRRNIAALETKLDSGFETLGKRIVDEFNRPRGFGVIIDFFRRNPAAVLVLGFSLSLLIHP